MLLNMIRSVLFITFCFVLSHYATEVAGKPSVYPMDDPDVFRNVSGLITSKGYPLEEHTVLTKDGYILSVQRIPHGRNNNMESVKKGAVLLVHGILADASMYLLNFPEQSLGFVIPDAGYDTWLLNTRGCSYSRKHVNYTIDDYRFWNFSFNEVALYDIPATIDHILTVTGEKSVYLIGMSQGTTTSFAMLSELPDYNDKVKLFIAIAPVTSVGYMTCPIRFLAPFANELASVVDVFTAGEFLPNNLISLIIKEELCAAADPDLCANLFFAMVGQDRSQLNETRLGVYVSHFPSGTSVKSLVHYGQLIMSQKFRKYDYGSHNMIYYHQKEPPDYDVSRISSPVALIWSMNDLLGDPEDVSILRKKLKTIVFDYPIPYPYNHADFVLALNADKLVNEPIVKLLSKF